MSSLHNQKQNITYFKSQKYYKLNCDSEFHCQVAYAFFSKSWQTQTPSKGSKQIFQTLWRVNSFVK